MSVQPPPTNTTTPLFNPIFYINPTADGNITIGFLDQNYLKFPVAQGSEEFVDGLFSVDAIDFNSATGGDRAITGISIQSFTDILDNASYTASIEENSTAIGIYDGGLIIESTNTIDLRATNVLINSAPISAGGDVNTNTNNTFINGFTNEFQGNVSFTNGGQILMNTGAAIVNFPATFPTDNSTSIPGLGIYWNNQTGQGETDLIGYGGGGGGGLNIYASPSGNNPPYIISSFLSGGIDFAFTPNQPTLASYPIAGNDNGSATIGYVNDGLTLYAPLASPSFTGTPLSTTASGGDNSTQIATTAFVQTAVSGITDLLIENNIWVGTNAFNTYTPTTTITQTYPETTTITDFSTISYVNDAITSITPSANTFTITFTPVLLFGTTPVFYNATPITTALTLNSQFFTFTFYTNLANTSMTNTGNPQSSGNYIAGTGNAIFQSFVPNNPYAYNISLTSVNGNSLAFTYGVPTSGNASYYTTIGTNGSYFVTNNVSLIMNCTKIN